MAQPVNSFSSTQIARAAAGLYDLQLGEVTMGAALAAVGQLGSVDALINSVFMADFAGLTNAQTAALVVKNAGITAEAGLSATAIADAVGLVADVLGATAVNAKGATIMAILNGFAQLGDHAVYGSAARAFNAQITAATGYASIDGTPDIPVHPPTNLSFNIADIGFAGLVAMQLSGNQDVRINFSNPANQITGLDLNGDGIIAADGVENRITGMASGYSAVDAYPRNPWNHLDAANNFLGDIQYDGTGFQGDGVRTNGNIVLGGLGVDTIFGGIGNDFLTGGGIAQGRAGMDMLHGGRNADFFFAEFAAIDATDGSSLWIDGGNTADNVSAGNAQSSQDSDWLLLEASDDDEPVQIWLNDDNLGDNRDAADGLLDGMGRVLSRAGKSMQIDDIENVDASGNFYGFLNDLDVRLGSRAMDDRDVADRAYNYGYGTTAQLWISGSNAGNIIIGGYDNDYIEGRGGNDLLMGGNLNFLNHPNLTGIWNNGRDEIVGGDGADDIVFETDGGIYEGGSTYNVDDAEIDTLWLTRETFGLRTAADVTTDGTLRMDLGVGKVGGLANYAGYGGADAAAATGTYTSDQTLYKAGYARAQVQDFENVIATGLGAVDYKAAGGNSADDLTFTNQQNHYAYVGNLDLRGTNGANTLYAAAGNDVLEGREGNDRLSGGAGNDDFLFNLGTQGGLGDNVDVIHRQTDANGDNIWDTNAAGVGLFSRDFGLDSTTGVAESRLTVDFLATNLALPEVSVAVFNVTLDGVQYEGGSTASLGAATSTVALAALLNTAFSAQNPDLSVVAVGNSVVVRSATGGTFDTGLPGTIVAGTATNGTLQTLISAANDTPPLSQDRIIYVAYEDRADNERVDDDSFLGSVISLGSNNYAEDLVYSFSADGTRLAERQAYNVTFTNLTTQDRVTIAVNTVEYTLQVGVDLDGNIVAAEDGTLQGGQTQATIQASFLARLTAFINSFNDQNTAAGFVSAALAGSTITLTQAAYAGEETVFMSTPVVTLQNLSGGEPPSRTITNVSSHEVHILDFDGRDNALNRTNVLFWGDQEINRSIFETAPTVGTTHASQALKYAGGIMMGSNAIVIDGGVNDLADTAVGSSIVAINNTATNQSLPLNFSVHGDDLLIGGAGNDIIHGGTGDDRIIGSAGTDIVDGGKHYVRVQILGETQARVYVANTWESSSVANLKSVYPELVPLTISSITPILQSESGIATMSGVFDDTLQFNQLDFSSNARFTIVLDNFQTTGAAGLGGVVEFRNDGAGRVLTDANGDGVNDHLTTFTNFENIRTVSGTGKANAASGQGRDTLDISALSSSAATGGVGYNMTNVAQGIFGPGQVRFSEDATTAATIPVPAVPLVADYESLAIRVDGVEYVITGTGNDLLIVDHAEADKDNGFTAGLGADRIIYRNVYNAGDNAADSVAQPSVTIRVTGEGTSTVAMTAGRNGTVVATDTLSSVERISLEMGTAEGSRENDVLDVTSYTNGIVVDYTNGEVRTSLIPGQGVQVTIDGIARIENIWADGDDTVIVASSGQMSGLNRTSDALLPLDADGVPGKDLSFAHFRDFDTLTAANARIPFAQQTTAQRANSINEGQYTFDLSRVGDGNDSDTVDYSNAVDHIAVVVRPVTELKQFVIVETTTFGNETVHLNDRVDVLIDVERVVASQGESVLDFTGYNAGVEIKFNAPNVALQLAALDRAVSTVQIADLGTAVPLNRSFVEYRDAGLFNTPANLITQPTATWNRIEGSDNGERVIMASVQSTENVTLNLRGGANEVKYNELTRSITSTLTATEFAANNALGTGRITLTTTFQDGDGNPLPLSGTHTATSYTVDNAIASGTLRVAASQDAEDTLQVAGLGGKLFLLAEQGTTDNQITVRLGSGAAQNTIVLTGYEILQDAPSNDVYDMESLSSVLSGLTLTDNGANDHDAIKVRNNAVNFNGSGALTIDLDNINAAVGGFNFDFDVLDVTAVTTTGLILNGGTNGASIDADTTDEVVLGVLSRVATINDFESMVLTQASVAAGTSFVFNPATNTLQQGSTTVTTSANALSFGGLVLEQGGMYGNSYVPNVTGDVTVTVQGGAAAEVHGGAGNDTITGSGGADVIRGNGGNDVLSGGLGTEQREIQILGFLDNDASGSWVRVSFNGFNFDITEGVEIVEGAGSVAIGNALVTAITTNLAAINAGAAWTNGALTGVTFNAGTGVLRFSFTAGADVLDGETIVISSNDALAGGIPFTASAETIEQQGGDGGNDTFIFEATAAANGADTIGDFTAGDTLDFTQFFDGTFFGATAGLNLGTSTFTFGAAGNLVVYSFNKGTLSAADFAVGQNLLVDNTKHVFITTADTDGVGDAVSQPYNVYYVWDANAAVGTVAPTVQLVGTVSAPIELNVTAINFNA